VDALLEAAGCDPGTSLAALCGAAAAVHFPGAGNSAELVSLLGAHSQIVAGRHVASVLLQRTSPAAFLAADQVAAQLQQNIHSSSSPFTHRAGQLHGGCHIGADTPGTKALLPAFLFSPDHWLSAQRAKGRAKQCPVRNKQGNKLLTEGRQGGETDLPETFQTGDLTNG
jgi:hypothetical protein